MLDTEGSTVFVGQRPDGYSAPARVVAVLADPDPERPGQAEIFLDRTPFYAESGGQVGDTGTIVTETGTALVYDTVPALPGLTSHRARITGELFAGQDALATIDGPRRDALRRNHTGTHLLHAALRSVLGDHVRQQGSLVAPDRLRFDFSHHGAVAPEELAAVAAHGQRRRADRRRGHGGGDHQGRGRGAWAPWPSSATSTANGCGWSGPAPHSIELCGGTHVGALGMIGPITVVSESSIGSNTRRHRGGHRGQCPRPDPGRARAAAGRGGRPAAHRARARARGHRAPARAPEGRRAGPRAGPGRELQAEAAALAAGGRRRRGGGPPGRPAPDLLRDLAQARPVHAGGCGRWCSAAAPTGPRRRWRWRPTGRPTGPRRRPGQADRPAAGRRGRRLARGGGGRRQGPVRASTGPSTRPADCLAGGLIAVTREPAACRPGRAVGVDLGRGGSGSP